MTTPADAIIQRVERIETAKQAALEQPPDVPRFCFGRQATVGKIRDEIDRQKRVSAARDIVVSESEWLIQTVREMTDMLETIRVRSIGRGGSIVGEIETVLERASKGCGDELRKTR